MPTALRIDAFQDEARVNLLGSFECQIDPEHFDMTHPQDWNGVGESSEVKGLARYQTADRESLGFTFVVDATGVVEGSLPRSVAAEIDRFKSLTYDYNGDIHSPNHLTVLWGDLRYQGRLSSLSINYTLFDPTGTPLRARLSVRIDEVLSRAELVERSDRTSPDLTHINDPLKP